MSQNQVNTNIPAFNPVPPAEEETIDIKKIAAVVIRNWYLYVICVIVGVFIAVILHRYAQPEWRISSKMLVLDDKGGAGGLGATLSGDMGNFFGSRSSAENEIQILKSRTLMKKTVDDMELNVRYYMKDGFKTKEIYQESPFRVDVAYKADTLNFSMYNVKLLSNAEYVISDDEDFKRQAKFGDVIRFKQYNLRLSLNPSYKLKTTHWPLYKFTVETPDQTVDTFLGNFGAAQADRAASTIDLSLTYPHPAKGEAILNKIMQLYLLSNLQNEKQIADSTYAFINTRIELVSRDLNDIERKFEQYKTQNKIADINEQSRSIINSASNYYDKLATQQTQLTIVTDLERYLNDPKNKNIVPSSLINPSDLSFGQAINAYNDLLVSLDKASLAYTEDNPVVQNLKKQADNTRLLLLRNIQTYKKTLYSGINKLKQQNSGFTGQIEQLPNKERNYLDFSRQQNLKQQLYLYLLQKREETAITRNSTLSSSRIVDTAKSEFSPFKPKRGFMYLLGLLAGLIIPSIYLLVRELFNIRLDSKSDIERVTTVPIIGEIGHNNDKQSLVTGTNSRSVISEQFRNLRTNLQFVLDTSKSNAILFTSSMSGEGKSFLSLNLGSALALTDKKVVFMEMDLRKPKLSESIGLGIENGFTNYAISDDPNFDIKKIIKPLSFNKNCFLISSGPIPPNPAELLMNGKVEKLIDYLKKEFDYIIMDCAPVGIVTDALMLEKHTDLTFYVTRQNVTYKSQLVMVNELVRTNRMKNLYLIINDIKAQKSGYASYGQGYGYGLEDQGTWLDKLKFWK